MSAALSVRRPTELEIATVVLPLVPPQRPSHAQASTLETAIDRVLQETFGSWTAGWRWAGGEGSIGGGPSRGWCCPDHSVWPRGDSGPAPTAQRAARGLASWLAWIAELARLFSDAPRATSAVEDFERRAHRVLLAVVQRTGAEDVWYVHAGQVLGWFLESQGCPRSEAIAGRAIKGRFESWSGPDATQANDIVLTLRDGFWLRRPDRPIEGLSAWWTTRQRTAWLAPDREPSTPERGDDAVLEHVLRHDAAIDAGRGDRMFDALVAARAFAATSAALTFDVVRDWQERMLGEPAPLRTHDGWAKDGRERYERVSDLAARVDQVLHESADPHHAPVARAARLYLDLCFLHPFDDGNARAARLALDMVLTRAGLAVRDPEGLLFRLPLPADDVDVGRNFQSVLAKLVVRRAVQRR